LHRTVKTSFEVDLLLPIDREGDVPLHVQLEQQLRAAVRGGRLPAGAMLPPTRLLAADLGVSRGVVVEAYEQLTAEGFFQSRAGSGTRVATIDNEPVPTPLTDDGARPPRYDFRPGMPDLAAFPRRAWLASLRRALMSSSRLTLGYPHPQGALAARAALADYLARSRATVASPERVVMCSGYTQGIDLVARLLRERGLHRVAIEDPGFDGVRRAFRAVGITTLPVPVDGQGLCVEQLACTDAEAVVVTPAHQFPSGVGLSAPRRAALLAWAARRNALIVEDDYDAEYRYDRDPLACLQGLAPERVIYIGTTSKTLSPALRLGWMLAPQHLVSDLARIKRHADRGSPTLDQLALADFLVTGELDRHLRRMRTVYRKRRDALVAALQAELPGVRVDGVSAGLHLMVKLPADVDEQWLIAQAKAQSIALFGAHPYFAQPQGEAPALVMGYGGLQESLIADGVQRLARLIAGAGGEPVAGAQRSLTACTAADGA
jgi:GntR family transcriptional regulator/MocR family aminotransferase